MFPQIPGPIVSGLANQYGCRAVSMTGAVIACLAFLLSTLAPNIECLMFTYGILGEKRRNAKGFLYRERMSSTFIVMHFFVDRRNRFRLHIPSSHRHCRLLLHHQTCTRYRHCCLRQRCWSFCICTILSVFVIHLRLAEFVRHNSRISASLCRFWRLDATT